MACQCRSSNYRMENVQQLGSFAMGLISSISCTAIDKNGERYELQFESDGSPIKIRKIKQAPLRSSRQIAQLECRHKGHIERILPRDLTAYIIQCLEEDYQKPSTDEQQ